MLLSLSEIVNTAVSLPTRKQKLEWLIKNKSIPLMTVLNIMYNKDVDLLIPNTPPPWKKNGYVGVEGMLYKETRRLKIFVKGGGYDHLERVKREKLFISLLEDIDDNDAELLCKMIAQKPLKGLSRSVVSEAYPELNIAVGAGNTDGGEE
jgi:hypothetical protein